MLRRNKIIGKTNLLEEIWQNRTKKKEVVQELKKENSQSLEDNRLVYIDSEFTFLIIGKFENKFYKKTMIL